VFENGKQSVSLRTCLIHGSSIENPYHQMSGPRIGSTRLRFGEDVTLVESKGLRQRSHLSQRIE
jgi:hypothetical protein